MSTPSASYTPITYGDESSSSGGSYSWEVSLTLLFYDEMRRLYDSTNPPVFDGGIVKEVLSNRKCKVKLMGLNKEVITDIGYTSYIKKGMYALILCKEVEKYLIISAKNFAGMDSTESSEYPV